jgi:hypothetical protein
MKKLLPIILMFSFGCQAIIAELESSLKTTPSSTPLPSISSTMSSASPSMTPDSTPTTAPVVDISDYEKKYAEQGTNAEAVAKIWFEGIYMLLLNKNESKGEAVMSMVMVQDNWKTAAGTMTIFRDKLANKPYIFSSYIKGTKVDDGYSTEGKPQEIEITKTQEQPDGRFKLFVKTSGADTPRPITLIKEKTTGLWLVEEFSSIFVDVLKP